MIDFTNPFNPIKFKGNGKKTRIFLMNMILQCPQHQYCILNTKSSWRNTQLYRQYLKVELVYIISRKEKAAQHKFVALKRFSELTRLMYLYFIFLVLGYTVWMNYSIVSNCCMYFKEIFRIQILRSNPKNWIHSIDTFK